MIGASNREFPAGVIGSVDKDHDFDTTVNAAVDAELVLDRALNRIRVFSGSVATEQIFENVRAVDGVKHLEFEQTVHAAGE